MNQAICGDCLEIMRGMEPNSIDAIVTDPPYGLEFMGKEWDRLIDKRPAYNQRKSDYRDTGRHGGGTDPHVQGRVTYVAGTEAQSWHHAWAIEALRVAKPGCHLLAFGGTRTFHRLTCAIEDAGWEIRDCLMWVYGSGFPKSHDVSKAIDKAKGKPRKIIGRKSYAGPAGNDDNFGVGNTSPNPNKRNLTAPATNAARQWNGWGTALKPAWEPIVLARKPLDGTVAENVQKWGTGAINMDGCRIAGNSWNRDTPWRDNIKGGNFVKGQVSREPCDPRHSHNLGRWPANLIHDGSEEVLAGFPNVKGNFATRGESKPGQIFGYGNDRGDEPRGFGDSGSAARFFYCAKSSRSERNLGLTPDKYALELEVYQCAENMERVTSLGRAISEWAMEMEGQEWHTTSNGNDASGQSPKVIVSIMLMGTNKTMPLKTWPCLTLPFTKESIAAVIRMSKECGLNPVVNVKSSSQLASITKECQGLVPGVNPVVSGMQLTISVSGGGNIHPTCKPLALMRYLCRLITPPNGLILDPFMGSGTTGMAAKQEGFRFIGIEKESEYCQIADKRIAAISPCLFS